MSAVRRSVPGRAGALAVIVLAGLSSGCVRAGFDARRGRHDGAPLGDRAAPDATPPVPGSWVQIEAGSFQMGSLKTEPCREYDEDLHRVTLTHGFVIQTTEVTQGQFQALMGYPSQLASCGEDCPVEQATWHEAAAYCNALSAREGVTPCYKCAGTRSDVACTETMAHSGKKIYLCPGYHLPSEAKWEYAYRAGTSTAYFNGPNDPATCKECSPLDANLDAIAWYCGNAQGTTHAVAQKPANAWKLHDMAGNVWEWCHDLYQTHLGTADVTDPLGSSNGTDHVIKGGDALASPYSLRSGNRCLPETKHLTGFRCVRTITP